MEIQRSRFPFELVKVIHDVADAHFIAFDFEFSGLAKRRHSAKGARLTLQQLYDDTKEAAEKYQILQVGLTVVREDAVKGCYIAHPYNFNISPVPSLNERYFTRDFSFNSGAVDFLLRSGFQFDQPFTVGIPYLSHDEEAEVRSNWIREDEKQADLPDMKTKKEDQALIDHIRAVVKSWERQPIESRAEYQNVPSETGAKFEGVPQVLNRYQMRLAHQTVRKDFPNLKTTGMNGFVQVTEPTESQKASVRDTLTRHRNREIAKAIGFRWLIDATIGGDISSFPNEYLLSAPSSNIKPSGVAPLKGFLGELQAKLRSRSKVIVGHNCFTDLVYLYKCFIGALPAKVEDFQELIHKIFPTVIDTKYLATSEKKWSTSLEEVELALRTQIYPIVEVPVEFDRYHLKESYHEAGYDSLLTAKVAIKLSTKMVKDGTFVPKAATEPLPSQPVGVGDEEYLTAAEDLMDGGTSGSGYSAPVAEVRNSALRPLKPVINAPAARAAGLGKDSILDSSLAKSPSVDTKATVVAIRQKPMGCTKPKEIKAVKNAFASSNIFDALLSSKSARTGQMGDDDDDETQEFITFSGDEKKSPKAKTVIRDRSTERRELEKKMAAMATKGEMMPRWNGDTGYWQSLGNRLQVNGCEEGVCFLSRADALAAASSVISSK